IDYTFALLLFWTTTMNTQRRTATRSRKIATEPGDLQLQQLQQWLAPRQAEMVEKLKALVLMESPTNEKAPCDTLCAHLVEQFRQLGGRVKVHKQKTAGDHLQVEFRGASGRAPIL